MLLFKKIVAGVFMALSVVAVVVLIIALFGSWVVKGRLETITIDLLLSGENIIAATREGMDRVDELLHTSHGIVSEVDTKVRELGAAAEESDPLLAQILDSVGIDLKSGIENAANSFNQIEANIIAINDAVAAIGDIPLLGINNRMPSLTKLDQVEAQLAGLRQGVTDLSQEVQDKKSDLIEGRIGSVTAITGGLTDNLDTTRADLNDVNMRLDETSQSMADLRESIPGLYTMITIVLNLLILLAILAFVSLFLHSWQYFKCPEQGLSGLMPGECEKIPAAA